MNTDNPVKRHAHLLQQLEYSVHELPAGVLYGADGANARQCGEWMEDLTEFETLSRDLGTNHTLFIEDCRWHFEHYPHYLWRRFHFVDYRTYVEDQGGPLLVRRS